MEENEIIKNEKKEEKVIIKYEEVIPDEYEPLGAWAYFGYALLYSIPILGWIAWLCIAIGASNINLKKYTLNLSLRFIDDWCLNSYFGISRSKFRFYCRNI